MTKKARRRILSAKITHLSLCARGMNELPCLYKSAGMVQFSGLSKMGDEGLLTSLVYVPNLVDGEGDVAEAVAIKQIAHDFLTDAPKIDIEHDMQPVGAERAQLCESFIVQKNDPRFLDWKDASGQSVDAAGAWAVVIKIHDPELRRLYRDGLWNGLSMFGPARVQTLTAKSKETMDPKELEALIAKTVAETLAKALPTPAPAPVAPKVEFEGDPTNLADVAKHQEKILFASLDLSKSADVLKWSDYLAKKAKSAEKTAEEQLSEAKAELAKSQEKLAKLQKASGQPTGEGKGEDTVDENSTLTKSQQDIVKKTAALAATLNKRRGL